MRSGIEIRRVHFRERRAARHDPAFYGFSIPEAENETSLADFVRARLQGKPKLGYHISFIDKRLVIQDMDGERITKVGLELEFVARA